MPEGGDQPLALVLSGGGARGAYEAGVLRYALGKLAPRLGKAAAPSIFCGTSVGAINACALAARAELPDLGSRMLADRWESLRLEDVFKLGWGDLAAIARWLIGKSLPGGITSLLDAGPLAELVREFIPWRGLHQNVAESRVQAVTCSATDVETGHSATEQESLSSPLYLFGKLLDALLLDRIENDLGNLRRVNAALFALAPEVLQEQPVALALVAAGGSLRPVRDFFIRPSQDLGKVAADVLARPAVRARLSGPAGYLMRRIGENAVQTQDPSDLLSYLLFDGEYARELIALGERDAHEVREELDAFLGSA